MELDPAALKSEVAKIRNSIRPNYLSWTGGNSLMPMTSKPVIGRLVFEEWLNLLIPVLLLEIYAVTIVLFVQFSYGLLFVIFGSIVSFATAFLLGGNTVGIFDRTNLLLSKNELLVLLSLGFIPLGFALTLIMYFGIIEFVLRPSYFHFLQSLFFAAMGVWITRKVRLLQELYFEVERNEIERKTGIDIRNTHGA